MIFEGGCFGSAMIWRSSSLVHPLRGKVGQRGFTAHHSASLCHLASRCVRLDKLAH